MFYVGSHKGTEDDGYVCSSKTMLIEYRKRPNDFKRRVIKVCPACELKGWEQRYLDMIQLKELYPSNRKYYNIKRYAAGGDITTEMSNRAEIIKRRYGKKHRDAVKRAIANRSAEKERLHQARRKASLRITFSRADYVNYQDVPFDVFVDGILFGKYRNKKHFAKDVRCDLSQINKHVKHGSWLVKQRRKHPFAVGSVVTFKLMA